MKAYCPHCQSETEVTGQPGSLVECSRCRNLFHLEVLTCPHCNAYVEKDNKVDDLAECPECLNLFHPSDTSNKESKNTEMDSVIPLEIKNVPDVNLRTETEQKAETEFQDPEEIDSGDKEEGHQPTFMVRILNFFMLFMPGLFRPITLVLFLLCVPVGLLLEYIAISILTFGAIIECIMIASFGLIVYAQGVALLFSGSVETMNQSMLDFDEKQWYGFVIISLGPCAAIFFLMLLIARSMN